MFNIFISSLIIEYEILNLFLFILHLNIFIRSYVFYYNLTFLTLTLLRCDLVSISTYNTRTVIYYYLEMDLNEYTATKNNLVYTCGPIQKIFMTVSSELVDIPTLFFLSFTHSRVGRGNLGTWYYLILRFH